MKDYTKKVFQILNDLEECIKNKISLYLDDENCKILLTFIQMQGEIIEKMAEHIEKGSDFDNRIKSKKEIISYFLNLIIGDDKN